MIFHYCKIKKQKTKNIVFSVSGVTKKHKDATLKFSPQSNANCIRAKLASIARSVMVRFRGRKIDVLGYIPRDYGGMQPSGC